MKPKIKHCARKLCALASSFLLLPAAHIVAHDQDHDVQFTIRAIREDGARTTDPAYPPSTFADLVYESLQILPPTNPLIVSATSTTTGTPNNVPNTLVQRDALGNFTATTIAANLTGAASLNVLKAGDTMTGDLILAGMTTDLNVGGIATLRELITTGHAAINGTISFANNIPGIAQNVLIVTQGTIQGPNEFNSIKAAVDTILFNSATNPYVVLVGPGVYIEDTITLKEFVSIIGESPLSCIVQVDDPSKDLLIAAPNAYIEKLTLSGATDPGKAALVFSGGNGAFQAFNCIFGSNDILINQSASVGHACISSFRECSANANAQFTTGFNITDNGAVISVMEVGDWTWLSAGNTLVSEFAKIAGNLTFFVGNTVNIGSIGFIGGHGFVIENGASVNIDSATISGFNNGILVPNLGSGPILNISGVYSRNNLADLRIDNPFTTGSISGAFARAKTLIDATVQLSLLITDPEVPGTIMVGPIFAGDDIGDVTNISPAIIEGSSLGVIDGGNIIPGIGLQVDVAAGTGYLMVGINPNDDLQYTSWGGQSIALPANQDNFLFINNAGVLQTALSMPSLTNDIFIGKARTNATGIVYIQQLKRDAVHTATKLDNSWQEALGNIYVSGSQVSKNGTLQLDASSGNYYFGTHQYTPSGGSALAWQAFYRNGSGNFTIVTQNMVDYNHYDDGSGILASIPLNQFARHAFYVVGDGVDETYLLSYAQQTYPTLSAAQTGDLPPQPGTWTGNIALIASLIVENTITTTNQISQINDERPKLGFKASGITVITNHGDLTGLLNDDHPQYLLDNGIRAMSGNLNMGTNDIVNVGLVDGVAVPTHASRHLPNGADPLATGMPVDISTSNQIGIANSFSRSDHVHNHGDLPGGSLHTLATTLSAGFMSATDKNILDNATTSNTPNTLVLRDSTGNFSASTITASLNGNATTATSATTAATATTAISAITATSASTATNFTGSLSGDVTGSQGTTVVSTVGGQTAASIASAAIATNTATSLNTTNAIVRRDNSGNFAAGTITAALSGNASTATTATNFSGGLAGDVTGTQNMTVVASVGGQTAANIGLATTAANAATNANTASTIVKRDASGNFSAGTITATLSGNATTATAATNFSGSLAGDVTGTQGATAVSTVSGQTAANVASATTAANAATNANTASTIVKRDASGNFSAGTITASLNGNAATATTVTNFSGNLAGDVTGTQGATVVATVGGQTAANIASATTAANAATNANTASTIVKRDASGNFSAGTVTANLAGNATTATTATNFSGSLAGDITGTQGATVVSTVSGQTAANVATATTVVNAATNANTPSTIVKRDASGNFSAGTITASLNGNANTAISSITTTTATYFTGNVNGDVTGTQGATVVATVGGQTAASIASATAVANAATNTNTASTIVKRDTSGNFSATTITANLTGAASQNVLKSGDTMTGTLHISGAANNIIVDGSATIGGSTTLQTLGTGVLHSDNAGLLSSSLITNADVSNSASIAYSKLNLANSIINNDINSSAAIVDTKLATISTSGKVANSATTGTANNNANTLVLRNASSNFTAGTITADLVGTVTGAASENVLKTGDTMTGSLIIAGPTSNLTVGGSTAIGGSLDVISTSSFHNDVTLVGTSSDLFVGGSATITGPMTALSSVSGQTGIFTNLSATGPLSASGLTTLGDLITTGSVVIDSTITFTIGVPGIAKNTLMVTKGPLSGPNQFNSIKTAIDSITLNSLTNPFVVQVGPGLYIEDTITLKPFVSIVGESSLSCIVQVNSPAKDVIIAAPNSYIEKLTLSGATNTGKAAIVFSGGNGGFQAVSCTFGSNNILVNQNATVAPLCGTLFRTCNISPTAAFTTGFKATDNGIVPCLMTITTLTWLATANPILSKFADISGTLTTFIGNATFIGALNIIVPGIAFAIQNGANASLDAMTISHFTQGIVIPNVGSGPILSLSDIYSRNNSEDLRIDNPFTTGSISGAFAKAKTFIDPTTEISLLITDPEVPGTITVGPLFAGDQIADVTNISPAVNQGTSLGVIEGGFITTSTALSEVSVTSGTGYLMVGLNPNDDLKYITWTTQIITLPSNQDNFLFIDNTGTLQTALSMPSNTTTILIGKARTDVSGNIVYIQQFNTDAKHTATKLDTSWVEALGNVYSDGSLVSKNGDLQLNVTPGKYFLGTHAYSPLGGNALSWQAFYRNGGNNFNIVTQNMVDYNHYDNGTGTLALIPLNQFARHAFYVVGDGPDEAYLFSYAQQTYPTLIAAQNGGIPPEPSSWTGNIALIASIIVENTVTTTNQIIQINDERPSLGFKASGVTVITNHGDLTGLLDDDHPQYFLDNGTRAMSGNLNMGTNDIVNVGLVDGVDVPSHASRHLPNGADPLTTAMPSNISTSNQEGIQNSFARSDHVHSHGNLPGGFLHELASTTTAGFMSAADKTLLNSINPANFVLKSGDTMTGVLQLPPGTNISPTLNFTGSATTGLSAPGANTLALITNGVTRIAIDSTGAITVPTLTTGIAHLSAGGLLSSSTIINADVSPGAAINYTKLNLANSIINSDISATAAIVDTKLATISTSGKVANSATTGTASNVINTLVLRDASGNFDAGIISASLNGNAATATSSITTATATYFTGNLMGDVTGIQGATVVSTVGGQTAASIASATSAANAATSVNTPSTIARRDALGNFSAGTITAALNGNASTATNATNFTGNLTGDVTGMQSTTVVSTVGGQTAANVATATTAANAATNANTANTIIKRDASGNFSAGTITAALSGNATTATSATTATTAINFSGNLAGDVSGTQGATVVSTVGGQTAANVATATTAANAATNANTASTIVKRDVSGNFSAGTITAALSGNATTATTATNFSGSLTGDVTGTQGATLVSTVGGQTAANVASATTAANAATNANTASTIIKRDASGNFSAGTITAALSGNAATATSATTATNFSGSLTGDVTGTQGATVVSTVGGQTAANVASATTAANAATNLNTASTIIKRDASGNFSAGTITAALSGNATTATSATTAINFSGSLAGDATGTQGATIVATVGGQTAANIVSGVIAANNATDANTPSTIIRRDASGNISVGTITGSVTGTASGNVAKIGDTMTGALELPAGTAALPALKFTGSPTAGLSAASANTLVASTNGLPRLTIDPSGNVTYTTNYKANAYRSTNQVTAATTATVIFNTENFDANNNFNPVTGIYTAPVAGYYLVMTQVGVTIGSTTVARSIRLLKNGSVLTGYAASTNITTSGMLYIQALVQLAAADQLRVDFTGRVGGGDTLTSLNTNISIHFMSL